MLPLGQMTFLAKYFAVNFKNQSEAIYLRRKNHKAEMTSGRDRKKTELEYELEELRKGGCGTEYLNVGRRGPGDGGGGRR